MQRPPQPKTNQQGDWLRLSGQNLPTYTTRLETKAQLVPSSRLSQLKHAVQLNTAALPPNTTSRSAVHPRSMQHWHKHNKSYSARFCTAQCGPAFCDPPGAGIPRCFARAVLPNVVPPAVLSRFGEIPLLSSVS